MRALIGIVLTLLLCITSAAYAADKAILLTIDGPIGPATQDYILRGMAYAKDQHAAAIIIRLDTPGGLDTSMRGICQAITNSTIPVIAYVAPTGARAASAGTFILYASQIAAMAPGTNIGAASPVEVGIASDKHEKLSTSELKARNDATAYIRSLAELRGRNQDWAEAAVQHAASISAEEAKNLHVINIIADNNADLLNKADNTRIKINNAIEKIQTKSLQIETIEPDWRYRFLAFLTDPNIIYILLLVAVYGLFFELANPGLILPGVAGIISLLLVLYGMQLIPVNYAGLTLIFISFGFISAELYVTSYGTLALGGIIAFIIGSIMLFNNGNEFYRLSWSLVGAMSVLTLAFFFVIFTLAIRSQRRAVSTGKEGLIGHDGVVLSIMNKQITVRVAGEIWAAESSKHLHEGQLVEVKNVKGLTLVVEPLSHHK